MLLIMHYELHLTYFYTSQESAPFLFWMQYRMIADCRIQPTRKFHPWYNGFFCDHPNTAWHPWCDVCVQGLYKSCQTTVSFVVKEQMCLCPNPQLILPDYIHNRGISSSWQVNSGCLLSSFLVFTSFSLINFLQSKGIFLGKPNHCTKKPLGLYSKSLLYPLLFLFLFCFILSLARVYYI